MNRPMTEPAMTLPAAPGVASASQPATLTLSDVTRAFAGRRVLGPLHLALDPGTLTVVSGANGAGKTTLLRVAAGLLTPSSGARACTGRAVYLRPGSGARHALTVRRALAHTAALTGVPRAAADAAVQEVCRLAGLTELTGRRVGELSAGQHARLTLALAVVAAPALVCLDEPTVHLDPDGVVHVRTVVRRLAERGAAVLLATHTPTEFTRLADASLIADAGLLRESRC